MPLRIATPTGRAIFLARHDQLLDADKQWIGDRISYRGQDAHATSYAATLPAMAE